MLSLNTFGQINPLIVDRCPNSAILTDDYSNPALWQSTDQFNTVDLNGEVSVHNGKLNFTSAEWNTALNSYIYSTCPAGVNQSLQGAACNRDVRSYRNIGATLSNSNWRSECKINIFNGRVTSGKVSYSISGGNAPSHVLIGITEQNSNPQAFPQANSDFSLCGAPSFNTINWTNNDGIFASLIAFGGLQVPNTFTDQAFPGSGSGWRIYGHAKNNNTPWWPTGANFANTGGPAELNWSQGILLPNNALNTDYWIRLERINSGLCRISVFSDLQMTVHIPGSPQCFNVDPNIQNLKYVQHATQASGSPFRSLSATIDDLRIFDACPNYPFIASASQNPVCPGQPVTLSTNNTYPGQTWSPGNISGSPITIYPNSNMTYVATAPMPGTGNQAAGGCILTSNVAVNTITSTALSPNFGITLNRPANSNTFELYAFPVSGSTNVDINNYNITYGSQVYGYTWEVSEVTDATGAVVVPGTTMSNPPNWWNISIVNQFPGYLANQSIYSTSIFPPAVGNFLTCRYYKITRGVWGLCQPYTTYSDLIYDCGSTRIIKHLGSNYTDKTVKALDESKLTENDLSSLNITPNPSNGIFKLSSEQQIIDKIEVRDVLNTVIKSMDTINQNTLTVSIDTLKVGVYFVVVYFKNKPNPEVRKIVIQ